MSQREKLISQLSSDGKSFEQATINTLENHFEVRRITVRNQYRFQHSRLQHSPQSD